MSDPEKITYFAETNSRNKRVKFGIKAKDRLKHVYVIGKTGMGKSTLLENMAFQDIQSSDGMAFIDPHGKTADLLLEYVPESRIKDVIYFAPFDTDYPISFNVMEDVGADKRHLVSNGLMSAFKKVFGEETFSDRMQYILQNTILALLEYPGSTMLGINKMLIDKTYRDKVVANITDMSVKAYWTQEFAGYTERFAAEAIPAIQNKIGQFTSNPLVRNIIGQPKSSFDFRQAMDDGKILIINLSKGRVGEANANLLGAMIITKIYLAAMSRADQSEVALHKLPNFYLYVDEFQNFANESFADILSEARKYKLGLTIAHQYIEQMSEEVRAAVFGNVGTMMTFRVGAYDAETLEKEFSPVFLAEDLVNLGIAQIYLRLMIDGVGSQPFSATVLPPLSKPESTFVTQVIDNSRKVFARPKADVERVISEWHEASSERQAIKATATIKDSPGKERKDKPREMPREEKPAYRETKAIDIRGKKYSESPRPAYESPKPVREERRPKAPEMPVDDFKPLSAISLEDLKKKSDNQRSPSPEKLSELRNVLSSLTKPVAPQGVKPEVPKTESVKPEAKKELPKEPIKKEEPKKVSEVPEAELLAILGIDK